MTALQAIEQIGNEAVKNLRLKKLRNGHSFMINSEELPSDQCYLEFPDGSIKLAHLEKSGKEFTLIRTLSPDEEKSLRFKYNFPRL